MPVLYEALGERLTEMDLTGAPRLFPDIDDRGRWDTVPADVAALMLREAEEALPFGWPTLPATRFLEFVREGNRVRYEELSFERRRALTVLLLGECIENRGRFIDAIVDGVWAICEETWWGIPAHHYMHPDHNDALARAKTEVVLPDARKPVIDLYATETAALLALTLHLLRRRLDDVTPMIGERIIYEIKRRVNEPYLAHDDVWWMSLVLIPGYPRKPNNWNPWCTSNCLLTILLLEEDAMVKRRAVDKAIRSLDAFVDGYPDDGGCDEGPGYWQRAGGSLLDALELLYLASGGAIDGFDVPKVREIGRFIAKVHIAGSYYVNFADCNARLSLLRHRVYHFGRRLGDDAMRGLALETFRHEGGTMEITKSPYHMLMALFTHEEMRRDDGRTDVMKDVWLPDIQVMTARETDRKDAGLYVAAKGGHNAESHNHNDIGQFIVYLDGLPVVVDAGVLSYTANTFSDQRYEIWTMQSGYHNVPVVNGVEQMEGREFVATDVRYTADDGGAELSMELSSAYPEAAGIRRWKRTVRLCRSGESYVELTDDYALVRVGSVAWTFMTVRKPEGIVPGTMRLPLPSGGGVLFLYEEEQIRLEIEPVKLDDALLRKSWGDEVMYRIRCVVKEEGAHGIRRFRFLRA